MYPRAPIALVAVEIAFPGEIGSPVPSGVHRAMGDVLGDDWVIEQVQQPAFTLNLGGGHPLLPPSSLQPAPILRFVDRGRGSSIALTAGSVSVQTIRYENWPTFRSMLETAVRATEKLLRPTGVARAGVRYIDEVRVGEVEGPEWGKWLSPTLLPPATESMTGDGWPLLTWTGAAQYRLGEEQSLVLRYGPQPAQPGFVVNPDGPLRRPGPRPEGQFFLLDFDSSWQPSVVPRWDSDDLLETCDQLRRPVRALFDQLITERLVEEVFKSNGDQ
ncbi:MAG: TIGR04255 family protein [Actinomycetota bacterium]|nr:TIGR04255 family protein [Actinomycetota bacterium]